MKRTASAAALCLLLSLPAWPQKKIEQVVARVNADIILKSDVDRELDMRRAEMRDRGLEGARLDQEVANQTKDVLRDLIDRALLLQVAKEAGLNADLEVLKNMEELRVSKGFATMEDLEREIVKQYGDVDEFKNEIRTKFLTQQVIDHEVYGRVVITNEEMRKYYEGHKQDFDRPAGVRVSEIVVLVDKRVPDQAAAQKKKIEEAEAALKRGDEFEEVARKYSEVATAENGGDLGFFGKEDLNGELQAIIEKVPKGQNTEILTGAEAMAIYKVTDRHDGGILSFELAQQYIWQELMGDVAPPKVREYLMKLRDDGFVEVQEGYVDTGARSKVSESAAATPQP